MKRDVLKIALVASLVFNAAVIGAFSYGLVRRSPRPEPRSVPADGVSGRPVSHGHRLARHIGVSRERTMRFVRVMEDSSGEVAEIRGSLSRARGELLALIEVPEPDERAIMAKVEEVSRLQGDLEKRVVVKLLEARTLLTTEERVRFMRLIRHRCMPSDTAIRFVPAAKNRESEVP